MSWLILLQFRLCYVLLENIRRTAILLTVHVRQKEQVWTFFQQEQPLKPNDTVEDVGPAVDIHQVDVDFA